MSKQSTSTGGGAIQGIDRYPMEQLEKVATISAARGLELLDRRSDGPGEWEVPIATQRDQEPALVLPKRLDCLEPTARCRLTRRDDLLLVNHKLDRVRSTVYEKCLSSVVVVDSTPISLFLGRAQRVSSATSFVSTTLVPLVGGPGSGRLSCPVERLDALCTGS